MLEPSDRNKNTNHDNRHKNKEPACQTYPPLTVETLVNMRAQPGFSVFIPLHTLLLIPFHMDRNNKTLAPSFSRCPLYRRRRSKGICCTA